MTVTPRRFAAAGAVAGALFVVLPEGSPIQAAPMLLLAAGALWLLVGAVRKRRPTPTTPWRVLLVGTLVYFPTLTLWYLLPVAGDRTVPYPSILDVAYLVSYAMFGLFLGWLVRTNAATDAGGTLDAVIVAGGASVLLWEFVLVPVLEAAEASVAARLTSVAYCVVLLVLLGLVVRVTTTSMGRGLPYWLLIGWIATELVGDVWYAITSANGTFAYGQPMFLTWIVAYTLLGAAAAHPGTFRLSTRPGTPRPPRPAARVVVLGVSASTPLVAIAYRVRSDSTETVLGLVVIAAVLLGLVLLRLTRLTVDLGEQRRVHEQLETLTGELEHQAYYDPVTGLGNRALFNDKLTQALAESASGTDTGVVLLDLDAFKSVNDGFGHDTGDEVLSEVGQRLLASTRTADVVARIGGDEFAIVLRGTDVEKAVRVAERVQAALSESIVVDGRHFHASASLGIVLAVPGQEPATVLRHADIAMYAAKTKEPGSYQLYVPELHKAVYERHRLETELRGAAARGELVVHYQPVFHLATMSLRGVEALVRWQHPVRGMVPPDEFIPAAETSGTIGEIGTWVLETSCRQLAAWNLGRVEPLGVAVNLSPRELQDPGLVDRVADVIRGVGIDPDIVMLEVTESALMHDVEEVIGTLHRLKEVGVRLAIDDFGTGYSSLSYLRRLPVDVIKIDRSFVAGIAREPEEWALTAAIIRLANSLGRRTLAEGIELGEQVAHLRALNCQYGQGYLFSRPLPSDELEGMAGWFDGVVGNPSSRRGVPDDGLRAEADS